MVFRRIATCNSSAHSIFVKDTIFNAHRNVVSSIRYIKLFFGSSGITGTEGANTNITNFIFRRLHIGDNNLSANHSIFIRLKESPVRDTKMFSQRTMKHMDVPYTIGVAASANRKHSACHISVYNNGNNGRGLTVTF